MSRVTMHICEYSGRIASLLVYQKYCITHFDINSIWPKKDFQKCNCGNLCEVFTFLIHCSGNTKFAAVKVVELLRKRWQIIDIDPIDIITHHLLCWMRIHHLWISFQNVVESRSQVTVRHVLILFVFSSFKASNFGIQIAVYKCNNSCDIQTNNKHKKRKKKSKKICRRSQK